MGSKQKDIFSFCVFSN